MNLIWPQYLRAILKKIFLTSSPELLVGLSRSFVCDVCSLLRFRLVQSMSHNNDKQYGFHGCKILKNILKGGASFVDPFLLFVFRVCLCHTVLSVRCSLVATC